MTLAKNQPPVRYEYFSFLAIWVEMPIFLSGVVAFFLWREFKDLGESRKIDLSILFLTAGAIIALSIRVATNENLYASSAVCLLLALGLIFYPWSIFVNRVTIFLGKISFSIYLLHFFVWLPLLGVWTRHGLPSRWGGVRFFLFQIAEVSLLTIPAALLTWRYIEVPGMALGKRLINRWEKNAGVDTPSTVSDLASRTDSPAAQF